MKSLVLASILAVSSLAFAQEKAKPAAPAPAPATGKPLSEKDQLTLTKARADVLTAMVQLQGTKEYLNYVATNSEAQAIANKVKTDNNCKDINDKLECVK